MASNSPILCYVTDRRLTGGDASPDQLLRHIENAASAGVDWLQIREKDLSARELVALTRRAIHAAQAAQNAKPGPHGPLSAPMRVLVNDRLDVAVAAGAAGVHLGGASIPVAQVVRWRRAGNAPDGFLVGVSCHHLREAIGAERDGADSIFFGPVYETPSKSSFGAPQGLDKLTEVCRSVRIPVLAIGGINEENTAACVRAGAAGIAAIRLFQEQLDSALLATRISRLRALF